MNSTANDAGRLTDDFFRQEAGKVVSMLVRSFGPEHIQLAEDVVQEAIMRALRTWPYSGVPENPAAWITMTAKNLALDALRRDQLFRRKQVDMFGSVHKWSAQISESDLDNFGREVEDAVLRLMFVCCHPSVPENSQPVLALKTLCGFGSNEVARALFTSEAAIAKRMTRAKERLSEGDVAADLPIGEDLEERLNGVLKTLYLLFNEGYKATSGSLLVKEDLCAEAIRLAGLLVSLPVGDQPRAHALLALMLFHAARLPSRVDARGNMLLLRDQDRSQWDAGMISIGLSELTKSASGSTLDTLHLQATIAAMHCTAPSFEATDWTRILELYDLMLTVDSSAVVALNRVVALGQISGPRVGLNALDAVYGLEGYYLFYAVRGEFESQLGLDAGPSLKKAAELTESKAERDFLLGKAGQR